jgi:antitoxin ChpS
MYTTNLRKVGGSVMLAVPPALLDLLQLRPGASIGISIESGCLVVEPQARPRYTLSELLTQCDPKARRTNRRSKQSSKRRSKQEREWLDNKPVGRELI